MSENDKSVLPPPIEPTTEDEAKQAAKELGMDLDTLKVKCLRTYGHWLNALGLGPVLMTQGFDNLNQVKKGQAIALEIAEDKKKPAKTRLAGVIAVNQCAKAYTELVETTLKLASAGGTQVKSPGGTNAPPNFLQLNVNIDGNAGEAKPDIVV